MKGQNKTPEKERSKTEIDNYQRQSSKHWLSGSSENSSTAKKIKEERKVTVSEIKNNPQETNREEKDAGIQINNLEHKEEINIQPEQKEETNIQKRK